VGSLEVNQEQTSTAIVQYRGERVAAPVVQREQAPIDPQMCQIVPYEPLRTLSCDAFRTQALYVVHNKLISVKVFCGCTEIY